MAKVEKCLGGCFVGLMIFVLASGTALAIAALRIESQYGDDECMVKYQGISFGYGQWLFIYGWTEIAESIILLMLAGCFGVFVLIETDCSMFIGITMNAVLIIGSFFQLAWYIVGAILFFMEVAPYCSAGLPLYNFGLALFIIKSVIVGCGLFSLKKDDSK